MGLYLGLISGTSMDAIDAALVDFDAVPLRVVAASATPYSAALKDRVAALVDRPQSAPLDEIGQVDVEVGRAFGAAAGALLRDFGIARERVSAIGSHGQTLRHRIDLPTPFTWQIGDPNSIAEATGLTVVADFRRRDVAAGGQGAPLVPIFHDRVFRTEREDRVIANVGGIANITVLRRNMPVLGFDTGPGNRLLDAWISRHQALSFDRDGTWAAGGHCDDALLAALRDEPYLRLPAPKSTGRELFNLDWLQVKLTGVRLDPRDVQATLLEYTAATIADAVRMHAPDSAIYVCGGGAHNAALLAALRRQNGVGRVASTSELGVDPDYVEAIAFAWFARQTLAGIATSVPSVTGAAGARILGGIYPAGQVPTVADIPLKTRSP
jgi:anhydro-N-acetylmuramic acid kinase